MKFTATNLLSEQGQSEVREELERILASPPFRNSRRYPALLRYVVEETLSGGAENLKERTLGVEVFQRTPDYDTNADPVVRSSASEVRRRIAQYYQDNGNQSLIEIGLPAGTYIPKFSRADLSRGSHDEMATLPNGVWKTVLEVAETTPALAPPVTPDRHAARKSFLFGFLAGGFIVTVLLLTGQFLLSKEISPSTKTPIMELWEPLLTQPDTVLITAGRTRVEEGDSQERPTATIEQHILRPEARISFPAVQVISQVAGFLETQHKQFRIHEAYSNTLQDLHQRPVVLVSGFNNLWTMRLLQQQRFHFVQSGALHYIVDEEHPERRDWSVDFDMPHLQQTADYAIVGRFFDPTTDGPVIVVAGIGSNGSQAAGEFVVSPDALESLARYAPHGSLNQNFEAVLRVEVVGGNTGAATVVATRFW